MKLSDVFKPATIEEGMRYQALVMSSHYGGCKQLVRGPIIDEGDYEGWQICLKRTDMPFPIGSDAQHIGYVSELPEWANGIEPPSIF